jgi:hypothetical protein
VSLRPFIALILGLVIQLSQMPSCWGGGISKSCATSAMSCCGPTESCPCAKRSDPDRKPAPAIPPALELKQLVLSALPDSDPVAGLFAGTAGVALVAEARPRGHIDHFAGVPLAVAFCSYLI